MDHMITPIITNEIPCIPVMHTAVVTCGFVMIIVSQRVETSELSFAGVNIEVLIFIDITIIYI